MVVVCLANSPASALNLIADYSDPTVSGGIFITPGGQLASSDLGGTATDVTALFKANVSAAFTYMQNSILVPWDETIMIKLFDFTGIGADGDSSIDSFYISDGRPATSTIRLDSSSASSFFVDPTPFDNSEFNLNFDDAMLGGATVNVGRYGFANPGGPAENRTDVLTLFLHELVHSTGFGVFDRFENLAGPTGAVDRKITVPSSLTGFPADFDLPFISASPHVDPFADGGLFAHAITAEPSFGANERWLPSGAELYALGLVEGAVFGQVNPNLTVPEPASYALLVAGLCLVGRACRRKQFAA